MTRADNRAPVTRIAAHYRERISSGRLRPGEMMPSISALADEWEVSTATADRAMRILRKEQLVRGLPGVGTEVIGVPVALSTGSDRHDRSVRTQSSWGNGEQSSGHTAGLVAAPEEVATVLGIEPGDKVIRRSRQYRDARGLVAHSTSWIPREFDELLPELRKSKRLQGGISLDLIAQATGRRVARRVDEEEARIATEEELQLLETEPGTVAAILVLTSEFRDGDDQVLEYGVDLGAPGRTRRSTSEIDS